MRVRLVSSDRSDSLDSEYISAEATFHSGGETKAKAKALIIIYRKKEKKCHKEANAVHHRSSA